MKLFLDLYTQKRANVLVGALFLFSLSLFCIASVLIVQGQGFQLNREFIKISLISQRFADYSVDDYFLQNPNIGLGLLEDAIRDKDPGATDVVDRAETAEAELRTPVATITPPAGEGPPPTHTIPPPSATDGPPASETSTLTPTPTPSPSPSATTVFVSATAPPPTTVPSPTPTWTPSMTPTFTPSPLPTNTPTFTPTFTPTNTFTPTPTKIQVTPPPTAIPSP